MAAARRSWLDGALSLALTLATATPLHAAQISLVCGRADVFNPKWDVPMSFTYEGDSDGVLKVSGPFGELQIPARRAPMKIAGETTDSINAVSNVRAALPTLTDLDSCISDAMKSMPADGDAFPNARDACLRKLEPSSSDVEALAAIAIGGIKANDPSGEDAFVSFKLIYEDPSKASDGKMTVEAFPAKCVLNN